MNKKLTAGVIAGLSTLALAAPVFAQVASSAVGGQPLDMFTRPALTAERIQKMIDRDTAFLTHADALVSLLKGATQTRKDALAIAAALSDETARNEAVKQAMEAYHQTLEDAMEANPALKDAMPLGLGMGHNMIFKMHGPHHGMMLEKLGMTAEELKTALESGKTIQQIADEKGIELPEKFEIKFMSLSEKLDMTEDELKAALESGKTVEQIAEEKGIELPMMKHRMFRGGFFGTDAVKSSSEPSAQ